MTIYSKSSASKLQNWLENFMSNVLYRHMYNLLAEALNFAKSNRVQFQNLCTTGLFIS
jgi:hypothetical protein